jgi:hypothetical protein
LGKLTKQDLLRQQEIEEDAWSCFRLFMFYKASNLPLKYSILKAWRLSKWT